MISQDSPNSKEDSPTMENLHYLPQSNFSNLAPPPQSSDRELLQRFAELESTFRHELERVKDKISQKQTKNNDLLKQWQKIHQVLELLLQELYSKMPTANQKSSTSFFDTIFNYKAWLQKLIPSRKNPESSAFKELWNEEIDPFGRDPAFEAKLKPFFDFLYYRYWRTETHGLENIPNQGRALLVANHSGTLPYDGSMIRMSISNEHPAQRDVRFLVEDFVYYLPFLGTYMYRVGGVRASSENAELLLNNDHLVAVFPEGVKGIGKKFSQRYHLQRFGRGGFIKLAIRTESPIIPVAVIGAEEIHPVLMKSSLLAKPFGIPYFPFTPTLPWLGIFGLIPLPSKWTIYYGKPIEVHRYGKKTLDDELQIHKLSEVVRQEIQSMIAEGLKKRRSVWWG